jgi:hypothetical protein
MSTRTRGKGQTRDHMDMMASVGTAFVGSSEGAEVQFVPYAGQLRLKKHATLSPSSLLHLSPGHQDIGRMLEQFAERSQSDEMFNSEYEWVAHIGSLIVFHLFPENTRVGDVESGISKDKRDPTRVPFSFVDANFIDREMFVDVASGQVDIAVVEDFMKQLSSEIVRLLGLPEATTPDAPDIVWTSRSNYELQGGGPPVEVRNTGAETVLIFRELKQSVMILPSSETAMGIRLRAYRRHSSDGSVDVSTLTPSYQRTEGSLTIPYHCGPQSNVPLVICIQFIYNESDERDVSIPIPFQCRIEVRVKDSNNRSAELGSAAQWAAAALEVVRVTAKLNDFPQRRAPVSHYDFRAVNCLHERQESKATPRPLCRALHCKLQHNRTYCSRDYSAGVTCTLPHNACNYIHGYSRLRILLAVASKWDPSAFLTDNESDEYEFPKMKHTTLYGRMLPTLRYNYSMHLMNVLNGFDKSAAKTMEHEVHAVKQEIADNLKRLRNFCAALRCAKSPRDIKKCLKDHQPWHAPIPPNKHPVSPHLTSIEVLVQMLTSDPCVKGDAKPAADYLRRIAGTGTALGDLLCLGDHRTSFTHVIARYNERLAILSVTVVVVRLPGDSWRRTAERKVDELRRNDVFSRFTWKPERPEHVNGNETDEMLHPVAEAQGDGIFRVLRAVEAADPLSRFAFRAAAEEPTFGGLRNAVELLALHIEGLDPTALYQEVGISPATLRPATSVEVGNTISMSVSEAAVRCYTGPDVFNAFNQKLRDRQRLDDEVFERLQPFMGMLQRGLQSRAREQRSGTILYRGIRTTVGNLRQYFKGVSVVWNGVTSTSVSVSGAWRFTTLPPDEAGLAPPNPWSDQVTKQVIFAIRAVHVADIAQISAAPAEEERAFAPHTRFEVEQVHCIVHNVELDQFDEVVRPVVERVRLIREANPNDVEEDYYIVVLRQIRS